MGDYRTLFAYQKAFSLAMKIYQVSKRFPNEERYGLTAQIRRSSRSVCANIVEAYKRRKYKNYFISKLNDSETENAETQVWLDFAITCKYLSQIEYDEFKSENDEVAKLVLFMLNHPEKFS
ncbi:MAG: four helix bundle protein [Bacteroidetes bacterium]|jgi:four helix bundle protein|nr:MAG: four helix bundle protein [Bacteroidota bacterium]